MDARPSGGPSQLQVPLHDLRFACRTSLQVDTGPNRWHTHADSQSQRPILKDSTRRLETRGGRGHTSNTPQTMTDPARRPSGLRRTHKRKSPRPTEVGARAQRRVFCSSICPTLSWAVFSASCALAPPFEHCAAGRGQSVPIGGQAVGLD
jgi:hypothetical protein